MLNRCLTSICTLQYFIILQRKISNLVVRIPKQLLVGLGLAYCGSKLKIIMDKIFRKGLDLFAGFGQNILFFYSFSLVHTKLIYMLYYYISIYYFLFSETYWYFLHLCRFFYLFLAHLTDCIIGQLHTFIISAMYSSRHVFAVVSNSFLLTSISLSYFD